MIIIKGLLWDLGEERYVFGIYGLEVIYGSESSLRLFFVFIGMNVYLRCEIEGVVMIGTGFVF